MALTIVDQEQNRLSLGLPNFLPDKKVFSLGLNGLVVNIPYLLEVDQLYSPDDFEIHLFVNTATGENDIFHVYGEGTDEIIGWLFPIQALLSIEHDYAHDQHFLQCAFAAFKKLLCCDGLPSKVPNFMDEQMSILDFYDDDDIILLLGKNQIKKIQDFNIRFYLPDLFKYGYRYKDRLGIVSTRQSKFYNDLKINIKLRKLSNKIIDNTYIYDLFTHVLDDSNILHVFLSLYQIIEILIFDIFKDKLGECLDDYSKLSENDIDSFFELIEKFNSIRSEKNRIVNLFTCVNETSELQTLCNNLLQQISAKTEENPAKALYSVRCNLVHSYRLFSTSQKEALKDITEEFLRVIVDLVIIYKK